MNKDFRPELSIKILRGLSFAALGVAIAATTAIATAPSPEQVRSYGEAVGGLDAHQVLGLVSIACLLLVGYLISCREKEMRDLNGLLRERPCIRDPQND